MTMQTESPTVTTLTAEVRTLIVGTRQVTLSIAKQLDVVDLADLDTMGRVKIEKDAGHVVGRHRPTGKLALARYVEDLTPVPAQMAVAEQAKITFDSRFPLTVRRTVRLTLAGITFEVDPNRANMCSADPRATHGHICPEPNSWTYADDLTELGGWTYDGDYVDLKHRLEANLAEQQTVIDLHREAAASPLIVLAGLR